MAAPKPAIYSPRAVVGFSAAFSALVGGILTFQSLRAAGRPTAAWQALGAGLVYTVFTYFVANALPSAGSGLAIGLGFGGGTLLNELFLKKQLPDEAAYPRKSVWIPLIICVLVTGTIVYLALMAAHQVPEATPAT